MTKSAMKIHNSLSSARVLRAAERQMFSLDNPGFCIACGAEHYECEPDAEKYKCDDCGRRAVYGAAQIIMCFSDQLK